MKKYFFQIQLETTNPNEITDFLKDFKGEIRHIILLEEEE